MYARHLIPNILAALADTPVVVVHGARQTGKSTLARQLGQTDYPAQYLTLDDASVLTAARSDAAGFIAELTEPVILDEVQRAPELLLAIKAAVDRDRRPGRFLLTGSANILTLPRLADTLVGRMEIQTLWPLSQGELAGVREGFIDAVFAEKLPPPRRSKSTTKGIPNANIVQRMLTGGYPEAVARTQAERRRAWFESYLGTLLLRDVRDLSNIAGLTDLPRLLTMIAARAGGLLNYADLARDIGLNQVTLKRYFTLLESIFLIRTIKPWYTNRIKRLMKSEKLYLTDTGLLAHLLDLTPESLARDRTMGGPLLENFVAAELIKQREWSKIRPTIYHFREYTGIEVDLVLESPGGQKIVGIEIKSKTAISTEDLRGLRFMADALDKQFHRGIIFYTGDQVIPFGQNLHAVPIQALWHWAA